MADVLITLAWLIILGFGISVSRFFRLKGLPRLTALLLLLIKFGGGLALTKMYSGSHSDRSTADIFKFYDDSEVIYEALEENPADFLMLVSGFDKNRPYYDRYYVNMKHWSRKYDHEQGGMSDTRLMIRLNALARVFSGGVYEVHILFWCFIALIGLCLIYHSFIYWFDDRPWWLATSVFLIPSVLAWSSAVLKEPFLLLFTGMLLYPVMSWFAGDGRFSRIKYLILAIPGFYLLKVYVLFAFVPALISLLLVRKWRMSKVVAVNLLVAAICILLALNLFRVIPGFDLMKRMADIQQDMLRMAFYSGAESALDANPLAPTWTGFLRNLPEALVNATLRPSLLDVKNSLQLLSAIENTLIALVILLSIGLYQPVQDKDKRAVVWFCLSFVFMLFSLTGLSTPVLGTLVRYRMPGLPFLGIALLLISDTDRLVRIVREIAWLDEP